MPSFMINIDSAQNDRAHVLANAAQAVLSDRNKAYGDPEDNFLDIAELWAAYKKVSFTRADVAAMMALMKIARLRTNPIHEDSWIDVAGYAACGLPSANADKEKSE